MRGFRNTKKGKRTCLGKHGVSSVAGQDKRHISALAKTPRRVIICSMMNVVPPPSAPVGGAPLWPLSVAAYHALGELGLIPEKTELLYGFVYTKMPKSPLHCSLVRRLRQLLEQTLPPGYFVDSERPISSTDSEPEPDLAIFHGVREDYWNNHPNTAELVAEICISSHEYDRSKLRAYAAADV